MSEENKNQQEHLTVIGESTYTLKSKGNRGPDSKQLMDDHLAMKSQSRNEAHTTKIIVPESARQSEGAKK